MTTLQGYLNNEYPTKEKKEKVKKIQVSYLDEAFKEINGGELNLSEYPNLEEAYIRGNELKSPLTKLEINNCLLTILVCPHNQLISLTLNCPALERLECYDNPLTTLNKISNLTNLMSLTVFDTDLELDLDCLSDNIGKFSEFTYFCCSNFKKPQAKVRLIEQELLKYGRLEDDNDLSNALKNWKEAHHRTKIIQLANQIKQLEEELIDEREEAKEAMQTAQRWRERQMKELREEKDEQIQQLQTELQIERDKNTQLKKQIIEYQLQARIVQKS